VAFTVKYLQRLNADELKELLKDDEAELSDAEKERINGVLADKDKPDDDPDDALIDRIADRVVGKLTAAEEIVDAVTRDSKDDDDKSKDDDDKSKSKGDKDDDDKSKDKDDDDKSKDNGKKDAPKPSLAARFHGR
jgi:hypothetical protein